MLVSWHFSWSHFLRFTAKATENHWLSFYLWRSSKRLPLKRIIRSSWKVKRLKVLATSVSWHRSPELENIRSRGKKAQASKHFLKHIENTRECSTSDWIRMEIKWTPHCQSMDRNLAPKMTLHNYVTTCPFTAFWFSFLKLSELLASLLYSSIVFENYFSIRLILYAFHIILVNCIGYTVYHLDVRLIDGKQQE